MTVNDTVIPVLNKVCSGTLKYPNQELIFHSDRGIQYSCNEFKKALEYQKRMIQNMSVKGNCYDNAVVDSFFKTIK